MSAPNMRESALRLASRGLPILPLHTPGSKAPVGFTADEAECWELIARAAEKFFELPVVGELDKHEIAEATHVFQQKLLARPAYRSYVDLTKRQNAE